MQEDPNLQVILHDTVLFPEGGGQPSDIGTITTAEGKVWQVWQVLRHGGHAVHYVRCKDVDTDVQSFGPGAKVTVALGNDGMNRRYDHVGLLSAALRCI